MTTNGKTTAIVIHKSQALTEADPHEMQEMANQIMPMWPKDCTPEQARNVARLALLYGLDPLTEEIIPYRGKPYITVWGRMRKAHESGKFEGIIEDRLATPQEFEQLGGTKGDVIWYVSIKRRDWAKANGRFGRFKGTEQTVTNDRALMARKRALNGALKEAFNMRLPGILDDERVATMDGERDGEPGGGVVVNVMANEGQIAAIHMLKKQLAISEEDYRKELMQRFGKTSSTELSQFQAQDLLDFWSERASERPRTVTPEQVEVIDAVFEEHVAPPDTSRRTQATDPTQPHCAECAQPIIDERRQVNGRTEVYRATLIIENCEKHLGELYCLTHYQAKMQERTNLQTTLWPALRDRANALGIAGGLRLLPTGTLLEMIEHYDAVDKAVKVAEDAIPAQEGTFV